MRTTMLAITCVIVAGSFAIVAALLATLMGAYEEPAGFAAIFTFIAVLAVMQKAYRPKK